MDKQELKPCDDITLVFKIISFKKGDCIAILENGKQIIVDPFVGCAFEFDQKEHLIGEWYKATGSWGNGDSDCCFLPEEGQFHRVSTPSIDDVLGEVKSKAKDISESATNLVLGYSADRDNCILIEDLEQIINEIKDKYNVK